jgi:hypothetical protein
MKLPWGNQPARRNGQSQPGALPGDDARTGEPDISCVAPGDAISFWGEGNRLVSCVFDCSEGIGDRQYSWRWIFLDDGSLVEDSADGWWRYAEHEIIPQGSGRYADLVGSGGALEQFETRVRNDTVHDDPVIVELQGRRYRVTSTGTVQVVRRGDAPRLTPWQQFVADREDNVYFSLVAAEDEAAGVLGIWTSHICLSFGRPVPRSDVDGVFHRA